MSILDSMKGAIKGTSKWLRGLTKAAPPVKEGKAPKQVRYIHVSKPISESVALATALGNPRLAATLLRREKGVTRTTAGGTIKREADKLAAQLGLPNKLRRRIRSSMKRKLAELQAGNA